jgi:peroxiredoxin
MILKSVPGALILLFMTFGLANTALAVNSHIQPVAKPYPAHPIQLKDLDDKVVRLSDFKGKTVIINFWATWCPPCRRELPSMQDTYAAFKGQNLVILGINVGENWETIAPFIAPYKIEFPILLDIDSSELTRWNAIGLPSSFVINGKGMVTHRFTGGRNWDDPVFRADLKKILASNSS